MSVIRRHPYLLILGIWIVLGSLFLLVEWQLPRKSQPQVISVTASAPPAALCQWYRNHFPQTTNQIQLSYALAENEIFLDEITCDDGSRAAHGFLIMARQPITLSTTENTVLLTGDADAVIKGTALVNYRSTHRGGDRVLISNGEVTSRQMRVWLKESNMNEIDTDAKTGENQ